MPHQRITIKKLIVVALSLPRSLLVCLKVFGAQGWKLPILIANNIKKVELKRGSIELVNPCRFGVRIGFGGSDGVAAVRGSLIVRGNGKIVFQGNAHMGKGASLRVGDGILTFGKDFSCNKNCFISCSKCITIGNDVLLGWNINIRDSDGHGIRIQGGEYKPSEKPVLIGNHVWIASEADILKGVHISDECVVAYRSCVTKAFSEKNILIAGYPAAIAQRNITWSHRREMK